MVNFTNFRRLFTSIITLVAFCATTSAQTTVSIDPAEGVVSYLKDFTLTFDGATEVTADMAGTDIAPYVETAAGERRATVTNFNAEGNKLSLSLYADFADAGDYVLVVKTGTYTVDGVEGSELRFNYTIKPIAKPAIDPAEGRVKNLKDFTLTFDGAEEITTNMEGTDIAPFVVNEAGERRATVTSISVDGNKVNLGLTNTGVTEPGNYTLIVRAGTYTVDGVSGSELRYDYTVINNVDITPAEGIVSSLKDFTLTFNGAVTSNISGTENAPYVMTAAGERRATVTRVSTEDNKLNLGLTGEFADAGDYVLVVPAIAYSVEGEESFDLSFNYTIKPLVKPAIDPAEGVVNSLKDFTLTFEEGTTVASTITGTENAPYLINADGERAGATVTKASAEDNKLYLGFTGEFAETGDYVLVVPAAAYTVDGVAGSELRFNYTIASKVTIDPAEGVVSGLKNFTLTFEGAENVEELIGEDTGLAPYIEFASGELAGTRRAGITSISVEGNKLNLGLYGTGVTEEGDYVLVVKAGTYTVDGVEGTELRFNYTVKPIAKPAIDPAEGVVSSLKDFTLTFTEGTTVASTITGTENAPYLITVDGERAGATVFGNSAEGNKLSLSFTGEFAEAGDYVLVIPASAYTVDGAAGIELRYNYTITVDAGIANIATDVIGGKEVYTLSGVRVSSNNLKKGVYVINGKKYVVR